MAVRDLYQDAYGAASVRSYASGSSNSPLCAPATNARHSESVNKSTGPLGLRE
jgi:hypothetical protein